MPEDEQTDKNLLTEEAPPNLDDVLARAPSQRWQVARLIMTALGLLAVVAFLIRASQAISTTESTPTGAYSLTVTSNVAWGTAIFNGVTLTRDDQGALNPLIFNVTKLPFTGTLSYEAAPFIRKACQLTLPATTGDSCVGSGGKTVRQAGMRFAISDTVSLNVDFGFGLGDLIPGQQTMVQQLVTDRVQQTQPETTVPAGGKYPITDGQFIAATTTLVPLRAVLETALVPYVASGKCLNFCPGVSDRGGTNGGWKVQLWGNQTWVFSPSGGGATVSRVPESTSEVLINLTLIDVNGTWQVSDDDHEQVVNALEATICHDGAANVTLLFYQASFDTLDLETQETARGVDGCLLHLMPTAKAADAGQQPADFLWRFGLLFAVNSSAHQLVPNLPTTSSSDVAAFH